MRRSSNPALSKKMFMNRAMESTYGEKMTLNGTINKTGILLLLAFLSASFTWKMFYEGAHMTGYVLFGAIGGLILALVTTFKPKLSPYLAPAYALLEGLVLGAVSAMYSSLFEGIVIKAILLTFSILFTMLFIYRSGLIKVTEKFKTGLSMAMGGIVLFYVINWILGIFGVHITAFHDGGLLSIIISLAIVVVASFVLLWDFSEIENGISAGAPKYMEWYSGFSIMLTLVWLYFEILRLLSYFSGD